MPRGIPAHGQVCGAAIRRKPGQHCRRPPVPGRKRCRLHGGLSPQGPDSPHWKTGRYSRVMPRRLVEHALEALSDPDVLSLRDEIMLVDVRVADLLSRIDSGGSIPKWSAALEAWSGYQEHRAIDTEDARRRAGECETRLARCFDDVADALALDTVAWDEIMRCVKHRRELVESERRRMVEISATWRPEHALAYAKMVLDAVSANVSDPVTFQRILDAIDDASSSAGIGLRALSPGPGGDPSESGDR